MRTRIKHRFALTIAIIMPTVLLTLVAVKAADWANGNHFRAVYRAQGLPVAFPYRVIVPKVPEIGVYKPIPNKSLTVIADFDKSIGRRTSYLLTYGEWATGFRKTLAADALKLGKTLIIQLEPTNVPLINIVHGDYDAWLKLYADQVRSFRHPVIIGFGHEMNGSWYTWGKGGETPKVFVQAFRHVVNIFRGQKAGNVAWIWTIHHATTGFQQYWPGANYVNIVGIDGYFASPGATFQSLFGAPISAIRKLTKKPILIDETAVGPGAKHLVRDIHQLFAGVLQDHLLGFVWFDKDQSTVPHKQNWELENRTLALRTFRQAVQAEIR